MESTCIINLTRGVILSNMQSTNQLINSMKLIYFSLYALCLLLGASLSALPSYAEAEEAAPEEEGASTLPEEGSKEWKRAMLIACQKFTADEFKEMRQLTNLLKKAKNERDFKKVNKMADDIVKKYSVLYVDNASVTVNGMTITTDDLKPCHVKLSSKRRKMYKDFLEYTDKQRTRMERNSCANGDGNEKEKAKDKKSKKEPAVDINMGTLDKIKQFMHANQEDFATKIDEEIEEKNQKNSNMPR